MSKKKIIYRPEINGLRALAIIPVILFHLNENYFKGGFLGVDIFFVISGYLITSIIVLELKDKNFSLVNFYERRVRRITPALFFVIIFSTPFFFIYMSSGVIWDYYQSLISISFFISNFLFALESNYFDISSNYKPFLHTWSLAVEEQYYILIPLLTIIFWRFKFKHFLLFLFIFSTISFLICILNDFIKVTANNNVFERLNTTGWGSFFMPFGRYWELIAGSIVAILLEKYEIKKSKILSILALIIIIFSFIYLDAKQKHPGFFTLIPVLSTMIVIVFSSHKNCYVGKILSTKPLVFIGLISYSLYLWHQPVFTFFNFLYVDGQTTYIKIIQLIIIVMLSFFTWKFIEKPFRNFKKISSKQIWVYFLSVTILVVIVSLAGLSKYGRDFHIKQISKNIDTKYLDMILDMKSEGEKNRQYSFSKNKTAIKNVLLIGDSQVGNWKRAIDSINKPIIFNIETIEFDSACYGYLNEKNLKFKNNTCYKIINNFILNKNIPKHDLVVIMESYLDSSDINYLPKFINYIKKYNTNILLIGNAEFFNFTLVSLNTAKKLSKNLIKEKDLSKIFYTKKDKSTIKTNLLIKEIAEKNKIKYYSEFNLYCEIKKECQLLSLDFKPFLYDNMHVTNSGAKYLGKKILKLINNNL